MLGKKVKVPEDYTGIITQENCKTFSSKGDRNIYGTHVFDEFTYWNWDTEPTQSDKVIMAMDWLEIAKVVSIFFLSVRKNL